MTIQSFYICNKVILAFNFNFSNPCIHWKGCERGESDRKPEKGDTSDMSQDQEQAPCMLALLSTHVQQFLEGEIKVIVR